MVHRDVIGVPVEPLRIEGHYHLGTEAAQVVHDAADGFPGVDIPQRPVAVVEEGEVIHA